MKTLIKIINKDNEPNIIEEIMNIEDIFNKKQEPLLRKGVVGGSFCIKCKVKTSVIQHPSKLCYDCWKKRQNDL